MNELISQGGEDPDVHKLPVSREVLYAQVWAEPMLSLAKKYHVSSSYLARVCHKMNIPRPERGYWAKIRAGKLTHQTALPTKRPDDETTWSRLGQAGSQVEEKLVPKPNMRRSASKLRQPSMHLLIRNSKALFLKGRETDHNYLKPHKKLLVDIIVTKASLDDALKIANEFFLAIESLGHRVRIAPSHECFYRDNFDERENPQKERFHVKHWSPWRCTVAYIGTVAIGLTLFETSEQVEMVYMGGDYVPLSELSGRSVPSHSWTSMQDQSSKRFCLKLYSPYSGTEWEKQYPINLHNNIKRQINKITKNLPEYAAEIAELEKEAKYLAKIEWQKREEKFERWRIQNEQEELEKAQKKSQQDLLGVIQQWAESQHILNFFEHIEDYLSDVEEGDQRLLVQERLRLAKELIGQTDPFQKLIQWKTPSEMLKQ
jgi:hypothetical protein